MCRWSDVKRGRLYNKLKITPEQKRTINTRFNTNRLYLCSITSDQFKIIFIYLFSTMQHSFIYCILFSKTHLGFMISLNKCFPCPLVLTARVWSTEQQGRQSYGTLEKVACPWGVRCIHKDAWSHSDSRATLRTGYSICPRDWAAHALTSPVLVWEQR